MVTKINNLISFVRRHGGCEARVGTEGTLDVQGDVVNPDGTLERHWEVIPATYGAVRDLLGY